MVIWHNMQYALATELAKRSNFRTKFAFFEKVRLNGSGNDIFIVNILLWVDLMVNVLVLFQAPVGLPGPPGQKGDRGDAGVGASGAPGERGEKVGVEKVE